MEYAQLNAAGTEAFQVTTHGNVEWDETHFCPASALTPDESEYFRVVPLAVTEPPTFDPITQSVMRNGCEQVGGVWQYRWDVVELFDTQAEKDAAIAADLEAKRLSAIPQKVTMRQARLAMLSAGLLDAVETAIAGAGPAAKIEWEYAQEVQRAAGLVPAMATALGMTDEQIDALFVEAATL